VNALGRLVCVAALILRKKPDETGAASEAG
jgi:hypothetical protein